MPYNYRPDARFNFTSFVVLLANIVYWPQHDLVEQDRRLIRDAINLTDKQLDYDGLAKYKQLQCIIVSLERLADMTVVHSRENEGYQLATDINANALADKPHPHPTIQFGNAGMEDLDALFVGESSPSPLKTTWLTDRTYLFALQDMGPQVPFATPTWLDEPTLNPHDVSLEVPDLFQDRVGTSFMGGWNP